MFYYTAMLGYCRLVRAADGQGMMVERVTGKKRKRCSAHSPASEARGRDENPWSLYKITNPRCGPSRLQTLDYKTTNPHMRVYYSM